MREPAYEAQEDALVYYYSCLVLCVKCLRSLDHLTSARECLGGAWDRKIFAPRSKMSSGRSEVHLEHFRDAVATEREGHLTRAAATAS